MQAVRVRSSSGTPRAGILRLPGRIISSATAPGNELLLAVLIILLVALIVLIGLTVREYLLLKRK